MIKIRAAFERASWLMFLGVTGYTEKEIEGMGERLFAYHKRVYDITMVLAMFSAFTFGGAMIYEVMSMGALGYVPPNFIQQAPIIMFAAMVVFLYVASLLEKKVKG